MSRSSFLVVSFIVARSALPNLLLSGNFLLSSLVAVPYLFWKYSSRISSDTPINFRKILLRSLFFKNMEIHRKRSSPWIVLCLLVNASLFACLMHALEWFVSNVSICENIPFVLSNKILMYHHHIWIRFCISIALRCFTCYILFSSYRLRRSRYIKKAFPKTIWFFRFLVFVLAFCWNYFLTLCELFLLVMESWLQCFLALLDYLLLMITYILLIIYCLLFYTWY